MGIRETGADMEVWRGGPSPTGGAAAGVGVLEDMLRELLRGLRMRPVREVRDTRYELGEGEYRSHELSPITDIILIIARTGNVRFSMTHIPDDSTKELSEGNSFTWVVPRGGGTLYLRNSGAGNAVVYVAEFAYV